MANVVELKVIGPNCTDTHISAAAKVEKLQGLIPGSRFDFVVVTIGVSATKCVNDRILKIYDLKADAADLIAEAIKSLPTQQHNLPIKIRLPFVSLF